MTPHPQRSSWALVGLLCAAALTRSACTTDTDGKPVDVPVAIGDLLADTWPEVVSPALDRAEERAAALITVSEAWSAAEAAGTAAESEPARVATQEAWWALMDVWQELEVMQLGPLGSELDAVGGLGLRDEVYSWPTTSRCRVDQETVDDDWSDPDFYLANLVTVYGLAALETLLYAEPGVNDCEDVVDINASGEWAALGADGVQERRAAYAVVLAHGVADVLTEARTAWDPAGGDFAGTLAAAGTEGNAFEAPETALNAIFDGLFYLEIATKDRKLAEPLGLRECVEGTCLASVETTLAGGSNLWIAANLRGFRALYTGGAGAGMDDLLQSIDQGELDGRVLSALDAADTAAAALDQPIDVAAAGDPATAVALHDAIKVVTDLLKGEVATALTMQIPSEAAGDND